MGYSIDGLVKDCSISIANTLDIYRHTSNISHTLVTNKIFDHSDVVRASPVGAASTTTSFSTYQWTGQIQLQDEMSNI